MLIRLRRHLPFIFNLLIICAFFGFSISKTTIETLKILTLLGLPLFLTLYYQAFKKIIRNPLVILLAFFALYFIIEMDYSLFLKGADSEPKVFFNHLVVITYFFIALGVPFLAREKILWKVSPFIIFPIIIATGFSIYLFNPNLTEFAGGLDGFAALHGKILSIIFIILVGLSIDIILHLKTIYPKGKTLPLLFALFLLIAWVSFGWDVFNNRARSLLFVFIFVFLALLYFSFIFSKKLSLLILILCLFFFPSIGEAVLNKVSQRTDLNLSIPKRMETHLIYNANEKKLILNMKPILNVSLKEIKLRILTKESERTITYPSRDVFNDNESEIKNIYEAFPELFDISLPMGKDFNKKDVFLDITFNFKDGSQEEIYYNLRPFNPLENKTFATLYERLFMPINFRDIAFHNLKDLRFASKDYQRKHIWLSALSIAKKPFKERSGLFNFKKDFVDPAINDYALLILHMTDNQHYHAHNNFLFLYSEGSFVLMLIFFIFSLSLFLLSFKRLYSYCFFIKNNMGSWNLETRLVALKFIVFYGVCFLIFTTQHIYGLFDMTLFSLPNDIIFWLSIGFLLRLCLRKNLFNSMLRTK